MLRIRLSVMLKVKPSLWYGHIQITAIVMVIQSQAKSWKKIFTYKTFARIHLRPLCYLGNLQSGVHVVRKTALNYSEREKLTQTCGHTPPNMGLAMRCMYHVTAINLTHRDHICDTFAHYLQRMSLTIEGCIVQLDSP